jgi:hypothetical protein
MQTLYLKMCENLHNANSLGEKIAAWAAQSGWVMKDQSRKQCAGHIPLCPIPQPQSVDSVQSNKIKEVSVEILDFVESAAKENAAFHIANADALAKESNTLLNLLLAGAGGSVAYFVNLVGKGAPLWQQAGIGAASAYLLGIIYLTPTAKSACYE